MVVIKKYFVANTRNLVYIFIKKKILIVGFKCIKNIQSFKKDQVQKVFYGGIKKCQNIKVLLYQLLLLLF